MYVQSVEIGWKNKLDEFTCAEENNMFCSNCGKKVEDESKFCAECGHPVGSTMTSSYNRVGSNQIQKTQTQYQTMTRPEKNIGALTIMIIATLFSAISFFLPVVVMEWDLFFVSGENGFTLLDIASTFIEFYNSGDSVEIFLAVVFICIGISIIIGIAALVMVIGAINGGEGSSLQTANSVAAGFSIVRFLIVLGFVCILEYEVSGSIFAGEYIAMTVWTWIAGVASLINLIVCAPAYSRSVETSSVKDDNFMLTRVCPNCRTSFSIGEICPKCGTKVM